MPRIFNANSSGLNEIARSPQVRAALAAVAEKGKQIAVGLSEDFRITGDYIEHFKVESDTVDWHGQYPGRRAAANLVNDAPYSAAVEWGNAQDHKPHHVLARTAEALSHE